LLLAGCATLPAGLRPLTSAESRLVNASSAAWQASGREAAPCPELNRVDIWTGTAAQVGARCGQAGADACMLGVNRAAFSGVDTLIYTRHDVSPERYRALVVHEVLHRLRACWVRVDPEHRYGATPECNPYTLADSGHCDLDVWTDIEADAIRRAQ
jgi:hypothetical protein